MARLVFEHLRLAVDLDLFPRGALVLEPDNTLEQLLENLVFDLCIFDDDTFIFATRDAIVGIR